MSGMKELYMDLQDSAEALIKSQPATARNSFVAAHGAANEHVFDSMFNILEDERIEAYLRSRTYQ
jgi:hypothetical protein